MKDYAKLCPANIANCGSVFIGLSLIALVVAPLCGVLLSDREFSDLFRFPPGPPTLTHAPFSYPALSIYLLVSALGTTLLLLPLRISFPRAFTRSFPRWGWLAIAFLCLSWLLAWTRFDWFKVYQHQTFTILWLGYIFVANALSIYIIGTSVLMQLPKLYAKAFIVSTVFWWYFEYLNRFTQNWSYLAIEEFTPLSYFSFASASFATVLPSVWITKQLIEFFLRPATSSPVLQSFIKCPHILTLLWALSLLTLLLLPAFPDLLFPILWLAPLSITVSIYKIVDPAGCVRFFEDGRNVAAWALAALVCGYFWELWNYGSLAKWIYHIPYLQRFHLFELPLLGYFGYLPFGLLCGVMLELSCGVSVRSKESK